MRGALACGCDEALVATRVIVRAVPEASGLAEPCTATVTAPEIRQQASAGVVARDDRPILIVCAVHPMNQTSAATADLPEPSESRTSPRPESRWPSRRVTPVSHRKLVLLSASCVACAVATLTDRVGVSGAHYAEHPHVTAALRLDSVDAHGLFTHPCPQTLTTSLSASGTSLPDRGRKSPDRDAGLNP